LKEVNILDNVKKFSDKVRAKVQGLIQKTKSRVPDRLQGLATKYILPYSSILLVAAFVMIANYVEAADTYGYSPEEEIMNLAPAEVAKIVSIVAPYTPDFEEDAVHVALAMKDQDFLSKPVITETSKTDQREEQNRKTNISYTVENGDTLSGIGWRYGLKISTIKSVNGLTSENLRPGQSLKLPPQDIAASVLAAANTKKVAGASSQTISPFKGKFGRPTSGWNVSQWFGRTSFNPSHTGIDLTSRSGTNILASASGKVIAVRRGWGSGYGNHIIISHGDGFTTLYGHMSAFSVSEGQWVNQGQKIGAMGSTGWSTGTHLHFEIRKNNAAKNPMDYL